MRRLSASIAVALLSAVAAHASGPRWVTGPPYFTAPAGTPVVWFTTHPLYFTDPGDLSASVNHAAADALVAAAAGVWNVPTSAMTLEYGGALDEPVSAANAYLSSSGPVFPDDVQPANYAAKPIAVIYDRDGSVTDMLLGGGASNPAECRQNAVTESVDPITPAGFIQHAILILNGRCTGAAPEQQLQMQYQLERAVGRILGIGWSQTNDNVFTGTPQPTYSQALHWPIMHPIDIVCGAYTYQCLPQPFTLRDDDVAAISALYATGLKNEPSGTAPGLGKIWTYTQASRVYGTVTFPTGEGMQGVNVVVQRLQGGWNIPEAWYDTSSVSGYAFQQNVGNPVTGPGSGVAASMGSTDASLEGYFNLAWIPDIDPPDAQNGAMTVVLTTEAINPLYVGAHAVGPYPMGSVSRSGAPESLPLNRYALGPYTYIGAAEAGDFAPGDAASRCDTNSDGVESAPQPVAATGWWNGVLCAHGHAAWSSFDAKAAHTATLEVTALDESGLATTAKAMPLIGVWAGTDATGTPPTIAATPSAFNTVLVGTTAASVVSTQPNSMRFVVADARGDGRPDFAYRARVLYADSLQPGITSMSGGQITISGMGFRAGNQVTVNGVQAVVSSWTANTILAVAPPVSSFRATPAGPVDVAIVDLATRGTTTISGALTYANIAPDVVTLVSAPSGTVTAGVPAATSFAVRVFLGNGTTPVVGVPVTFTSTPSGVQFGACATTPCVVLTDANGLASTTVTPMSFGSFKLEASAVGATQSAAFNAVTRSIAVIQPVAYVAAGAIVAWTPQANVVQNSAPAVGAEVHWSGSSGMTLSPATTLTDSQGVAQTSAVAGPLAAGTQATGQACAWTTVCASFITLAVDSAAWRLVVLSGAGQSVSTSSTFAPVVVQVTDVSGKPVAGAPVTIHQTVDAAEMPCPTRGPCPIAPILAASTTSAISDSGGLVGVTPMQIADTAEVTNIAVAAGTQSFVSLSLQQGP